MQKLCLQLLSMLVRPTIASTINIKFFTALCITGDTLLYLLAVVTTAYYCKFIIALMHNLKHNQVLHQINVILTVAYTEMPVVALDKRLQISDIGAGFWKAVVHFGFIEKTLIFPRH